MTDPKVAICKCPINCQCGHHWHYTPSVEPSAAPEAISVEQRACELWKQTQRETHAAGLYMTRRAILAEDRIKHLDEILYTYNITGTADADAMAEKYLEAIEQRDALQQENERLKRTTPFEQAIVQARKDALEETIQLCHRSADCESYGERTDGWIAALNQVIADIRALAAKDTTEKI